MGSQSLVQQARPVVRCVHVLLLGSAAIVTHIIVCAVLCVTHIIVCAVLCAPVPAFTSSCFCTRKMWCSNEYYAGRHCEHVHRDWCTD